MRRAISLLFLLAIAGSGASQADGFVSQYGWTCEGSSPQFKYVRTDVLFMVFVDGRAHYRVRTVTSAELDLRDVKKLTTIDHVLEVQSDQAYVYEGMAPGGTGPAVQLTIRKVQGSDQGLRATLSGTALEYTAKLTCSRTRS